MIMTDKKSGLDSLSQEGVAQFRNYYWKLRTSYRTGEADRESLIRLIRDAMGKRSQRKFAEDLSVNVSSISRILNGKVSEVSDSLLAKIAVCAVPDSGVTIEKLMEAQGIVEAQNLSELSGKLENNCRRIMVDDLLRRGFSVAYSTNVTVSPDSRRFDFELITDAVGNGGRWLVEVKTAFFEKMGVGPFSDWLDSAMAIYYSGSIVGRISVLVDHRTVFEQVKNRLSELCIPDEISVILISTASGRVLDEYIAPLRDGRSARFVFGKEAGI